jgi:hypothetical protein
VVAPARLLARVDKIVQQVEPVRDVDSTRRADSRALGVALAAVVANDLDTRMRAELSRQCRGFTVGQKVDHAPMLQVDENHAVALAATHHPVIDAEHTRVTTGRLVRRAEGGDDRRRSSGVEA